MRQVTEPLFSGSMPGPSRKYLTQALAATASTHEQLLIPAVDQFDIARIAIAAGWSPDRIWTSDVGLVPRMLGALVDESAPLPVVTLDPTWAELQALVHADHRAPLARQIAYRLWLIRRQQMVAAGYLGPRVHDLDVRAAVHVGRLEQQLNRLAESLAGVHFDTVDLREVVLTAGVSTVVVVDPPQSSETFKKAHQFGDALVHEPPVAGFVWHKEQAALYADACTGSATQLWTANGRTVAGYEDDVVFAIERKPSQIDYWLCTRPAEVPRGLVSFSRPEVGPIDAPILGEDDEIRPDSSVTWLSVTPATIAYYRGLWAHKLPATSGAEVYLLLLIDGKVTAIAMFRTNGVASLQTDDVELVSGFTAPSTRYPRTSRLLTLLITSAEFEPILHTRQSINRIFRIRGVATTVMSKYRKTKALNGLMTPGDRERRPDGTYRIRYRADFRPDTYRDALTRFVDEETAHAAR